MTDTDDKPCDKVVDFRIACMSCYKATKYDALAVLKNGEVCDKCGEKL
jgi:rRNA maturation endonuclease Nob1